jgi:hypothetical protein
MFDEPNETPDESKRPLDPAQRAQERAEEFRVHAEVCAVFEGPRKFDAQILPTLTADVARDVQKRIAKLEKSKTPDSPILPPAAASDAAELLNFPATHNLSTNDYHLYRRPGELMVIRFLAGDEVDSFYTRIQAHFDAALDGFREEERQTLGWKQDPTTLKYLDALDALQVSMPDRYLRDPIRTHKVFVLSTLTADEMDIQHLADYIMGSTASEIVGPASAPPEDAPTEKDRAWFFKLFALRGIIDEAERMLFFTYMQKTEESFDF